ncbi:hypothetical protein BBU64B_J0018 (plasmid) [Borreliella burgdorferi 64b]|nr:hypothetical protein BBU64B_J0018 [Borreliella burgdorferi 64b]
MVIIFLLSVLIIVSYIYIYITITIFLVILISIYSKILEYFLKKYRFKGFSNYTFY